MKLSSLKPSLPILLSSLTFVVPGIASAEQLAPVDQSKLNALSAAKGSLAAFIHAFEAGDELSEHQFDSKRGVGANIGEGRRFARFPRADLKGPGEWAQHFPKREGGANSTSCVSCHNAPIANGAGDIAQNVLVDPAHTGDPTKYLERNTLPIFALGPVQIVAEEMSIELYARRAAAKDMACTDGASQMELSAKGISFGVVSVTRTSNDPCTVQFDWSQLEGVDEDLVIRPFGWKGNKATIREFTRGAANNELGLQAVELVGNADGDFDSVTNELTVGDMTALTIYMAALERPVSKIELHDAGLLDLSDAQRTTILRGERVFAETGCASCHKPRLPIADPVFTEPSQTPGYFDTAFLDGSLPAEHGLMSDRPIRFDITKDQPNNRIPQHNGAVALLGATPVDQNGNAIIRWFSDFKRHDLGEDLADPSAPLGIGARMWLTRSLAGVGSTGPWLHDGRATTLDEAIVAHGGEAESERSRYEAMSTDDRTALIAFLENLVVYKYEPENGEEEN